MAFADARSLYFKKQESLILGCVNNMSNTLDLAISQKIDMDISSPNSYQSTSLQPYIMADHSQIDIMSKGKDKKKKYKKNTITHDDINKDFRSSVNFEIEFT
ncbi:hypothetical protein RclHR1_19960002 [Rhizophagus clarus]|uniref:Uncharacterized protein n=1 Tax=Rhizophagus clarus TaxID=94130 RepID=A0A2Z6QQB6_9GLOM|nr:hypothetical protein RclHR1_19960002 [Rhizophagus clarus]GES90644.1 hypothetical protein RCL_jg14227.t1 [Rhizophagus clarus]